jgi:glycosyltransferase 2 family protein
MWKWAALAVLAVAAAWWLRTQWAGFDWRLAAASFTGMRWGWLLGAVAAVGGTYVGRALRWAVFLKPLRPHPSLRNLLSATVIGYAALVLLGRPGEFVRPYLIAVKERVPIASQLAALVLERIFDLLLALLIFALALARVRASGVHAGARLTWVLSAGGWVVGIACLALLLLLLGLRHFSESGRRRLTAVFLFLPEAQYRKIEKAIRAFVAGVESMRSDAALALVMAYSVLEWALIAACYWCMIRAFPATDSFTLVDSLIVMGFVSFGAVFQIPGIGGGVQVVATLVLVELFHMRVEAAASFAVALWILTFVAIVPVGLFVALKEGLSWRGLRRIGPEAEG